MTKKTPFVSIIIAFYVDTPRFYRDLARFSKLKYRNYEILVVTDNSKLKIKQDRVKVIYTNEKRTGPAEKRDFAIAYAKGDLCAFIDDDAYPHPHWLSNAVKNFNESKVGAVGGPGVTPPDEPYWAQVTGIVYQSYLCGGPTQHRFIPSYRRYVDDYPAYNLIVSKKVMKKVGGYGNHFYGGEDTFLCLKIIKAGYKIVYDPTVLVYHHRRHLFNGFFKQIRNIGLHRGYFAKVYPETSRKPFYFLPSLFLTSELILLFLGIFNPIFWSLAIVSLTTFFLVAFLSVIQKTDIVKAAFASIGILGTHLNYGISFLQGLLTTKLNR